MRILLLILTVALLPIPAFSASHYSHRSDYAGQESREIKSLSEDDIEELRNGTG